MTSDSDLIAAYRRGDRSACPRLIRRHHVAVFNLFYSLMGSDSTANALTRQVFIRLFTGRDDIARSFAVHLYRTCHVCWTEYVNGSAGPDGRALPFPQMDSTAHDGQDVIGLLSSLPHELRVLVVLREMNGLSYSDIARVVDIPDETVKRRMQEAYRCMRLRLGTGGPLNAAGNTALAGGTGPQGGATPQPEGQQG